MLQCSAMCNRLAQVNPSQFWMFRVRKDEIVCAMNKTALSVLRKLLDMSRFTNPRLALKNVQIHHFWFVALVTKVTMHTITKRSEITNQ